MQTDQASYFDHKRLIITGASGYLATNLINQLTDIDCTIIRVSRKKQLTATQGKARIEDVCGDLTHKETWERVLRDIDIVYHLAAQTSVAVAESNPLVDWQANVAPMLHALETCKEKHESPAVIFSGTVTEVGIPKYWPVDESHEDIPVTIYDLHKLMAEHYLKYYARHDIVKGTCLRLSNVYGPGPDSSSPDRAVINGMIRRALAGKSLTVYGAGACLRDYVHVNDAVAAFLLAPAYIERLNGKHFVIGSGEGHTIAQAFTLVAERVALRTRNRVTVEHIAPPVTQSPIDTRNFVADTRQFASITGWQARHSLADGIDDTLEALQHVCD